MMLGLCPLCGKNKPTPHPVTIMVNKTPTDARICDTCKQQLEANEKQPSRSRSKISG